MYLHCIRLRRILRNVKRLFIIINCFLFVRTFLCLFLFFFFYLFIYFHYYKPFNTKRGYIQKRKCKTGEINVLKGHLSFNCSVTEYIEKL